MKQARELHTLVRATRALAVLDDARVLTQDAAQAWAAVAPQGSGR